MDARYQRKIAASKEICEMRMDAAMIFANSVDRAWLRKNSEPNG